MNRKTANELLENSIIERSLAEKLLCYLLNVSQSKLLCDKKSILISKTNELKFLNLQEKIKNGLPLQYAIGKAYFYGREFIVDRNVLIPRAETEILVQEALKFLELRINNNESWLENEIQIIDIGTGSGCIAISIYKELNKLYPLPFTLFTLTATDISPAALSIAKKNAKKHQTNIKFYKSDLFSNKSLPEKFDLILANLPYLKNNFMDENQNLKFEPKIALDGGKNGLDTVSRLIDLLPRKLAKGGMAILEIDPRQELDLRRIFAKTQCKTGFKKDLTLRTRFVQISP